MVFITNYNYFKLSQAMELEKTQEMVTKDTFNYLGENSNPPSYHRNQDCELLKSDYDPVLVIPQEIKIRQDLGNTTEERVNTFRKWCATKEMLELKENDFEKFIFKIEGHFKIRFLNSEKSLFKTPNSGHVEFLEEILLKYGFKPCNHCYRASLDDFDFESFNRIV